MVHRALTIPELIHLIVNNVPLGDDGWPSSDWRSPDLPTLQALALTCRAFHEPALDVLWSLQEGLSHLVECLPTDLWTILDDRHGTLTLNEPTRPTTHQDWERLEFYARRVRSLRYGPRKSPLNPYLRMSRVLSGKLFRWLLSSSPSHHLLPRLRFLEWYGSDIPFDYVDSAHMLFGPQLYMLDIGSCLQMLVHLHRRSPDIQDLHIHPDGNGGPDSDHQPIPRDILTSLTPLRSLTLESFSPFDIDVLAGLSTLPHLTEVKIVIATITRQDKRSLLETDYPAAQSLEFRALKSITLVLSFMTELSTILSVCRFPRLRRLNLTSFWGSEPHAFDEMLQVIHDCCSHGVLETIQIHTVPGQLTHLEEGIQVITATSLSRLCAFRRMRKIWLLTEMYIALDDYLLEEMAMAWPCLESLRFQSMAEDSWLIQNAATLEGLVPLARYCPSLKSLTIDVDPSDTFISPHAEPGGGHCNRVLRSIDFKQPFATDIYNVAEIGAFLYAIFPNLQAINEYDSTMTSDCWRLVENTVHVLRKVSQWPRNAGES
ncbi:uncharacterized protein B0H18DRAFT_527284 [Fomitopsis serialis]|uniref:uncharacterized protein n=1 Tax=Fomitopsis serialis TaxID=139415 RepID=UPI002007DB6A|nr:uncharacterized protein B0H18DRAFT_527284 [Neoantrodia serialis]KAH9922099.1 hypothetical protein B0H18DRAFT_527284 [Neoantrodia serialis]